MVFIADRQMTSGRSGRVQECAARVKGELERPMKIAVNRRPVTLYLDQGRRRDAMAAVRDLCSAVVDHCQAIADPDGARRCNSACDCPYGRFRAQIEALFGKE